MRTVMEVIGIVLLINGIGGLVSNDFGVLGNLATGGALTTLQLVAVALGAALVAAGLLGRKAEKSRREESR